MCVCNLFLSENSLTVEPNHPVLLGESFRFTRTLFPREEMEIHDNSLNNLDDEIFSVFIILRNADRGGSRAAATSKMECNYHKSLHLRCCSSPRSASGRL